MTILSTMNAALDAFEKGYVPIPCYPGKKIAAIRWNSWMQQSPTRDRIEQLFRGRNRNVAVLNKDHLTFDVDDPNELDFVIDKAGPTPSIRRTPSGGFHLDYGIPRRAKLPVTNRIKLVGRDIDMKAPGKGYVVIPPSTNIDRVPYEWIGETKGLVPINELPPPRIAWTRSRTRRSVQSIDIDDNDLGRRQRRARAYLANVEGAISGQRGHDRTMRVAGVLIQKFRLSIDEALPLFFEWNDQCEPPWSEAELLHKLESAMKNRSKYT